MYATSPYAAAARRYGYAPMVAVGADPAAEPTLTDKVKNFLNAQNSLLGVQNKWIVGGAAVVGIGLYAGWFGGRRRRH